MGEPTFNMALALLATLTRVVPRRGLTGDSDAIQKLNTGQPVPMHRNTFLARAHD